MVGSRCERAVKDGNPPESPRRASAQASCVCFPDIGVQRASEPEPPSNSTNRLAINLTVADLDIVTSESLETENHRDARGGSAIYNVQGSSHPAG